LSVTRNIKHRDINMAHKPSILTLQDFAAEVAAATKVITEYCSAHGHPQPSLYIDAAEKLTVLPEDAPKEVRLARQRLIDATTRIQQVSREPSEHLPQLGVNVRTLIAVTYRDQD
jgi:hypothetical protein